MSLTDSPWKDLLELFARNPVKTIGAQPAYQKLCEQYAGRDGFGKALSLVEGVAVTVQTRMSRALGPTEETAAGLRLLKRVRVRTQPQMMEICYALLWEGYSSGWSPKQQAYFRAGYQKLCLPYDFFFSFSTRNDRVDGVNPVNNSYKHFILKILSPEYLKTADWQKENLLAKAVYTLMAQKDGRKGFYFPDSQYDQTITEDKLEKMLRDAHVFVQVIQNVMFLQPVGENYCHWEFVRAHRLLDAEHQVEQRMLFLIAERENRFYKEPDDVHPDYAMWLLQIRRRDVPYIPEVSVASDAEVRNQEVEYLIENKLVALIDAAWDRLIDNVPAD